MTLQNALFLATALFAIGLYGLLTRRHVVAILLSVELMANAANLVFVAFSRFRGVATGQIFAIFSLAITVAEVAVGLALVILLYRSHGDTRVELASEMKQ
jgi:NADH-quinone oxidoreductase subunit K